MTDDNNPPRYTAHEVVQFPEVVEDVGAQKRLAAQLVAQMMVDPRERRAVMRYMQELIGWLEDPGGRLAVSSKNE